MCAISLPVRKTNAAVFDNGDSAPRLSLTKATEQKWAALGLFVRMHESPRRAEKGRGEKHIEVCR